MSRTAVGLRFGLVGIVNTLVDLVLYTGLSLLGVATVPANLVSTTAGTACSFVLNRGFTFRATAGSLRRQVLLFVVVNVIGLWVLHPLVIGAVESVLPPASALVEAVVPKTAAIAVGLVWNFLLYSRLVFRPEAPTPAEAPAVHHLADATSSADSAASASSESGTSPGEEYRSSSAPADPGGRSTATNASLTRRTGTGSPSSVAE